MTQKKCKGDLPIVVVVVGAQVVEVLVAVAVVVGVVVGCLVDPPSIKE